MYEVDRHIDLIEKGEKVIQETRGWNEIKLETFSQRKKENAHDYRYFPDPDLPKMYLHEYFNIDEIKSKLPTLPEVKEIKYKEIGLNDKQIEQLLDNINLGKYFEEISIALDGNSESLKLAGNYLLTDAVGLMSKDIKLKLPSAINFAQIIKMIEEGSLSSRGAKDLLLDLMQNDTDPLSRAKELNLLQVNDPEANKKIVEQVISENKTQWDEYKAGAVKLEMFFVGKCMAASKGSGNPKVFIDIIKTL
jgi:aspartyl-tRNA(Asn)/glutamyl-tRNA(Gln) amidotransferase subunit B